MEHEIYVPFSATVVRAALAEQERIARCVPGFQVEPGDDPDALAGRLRLRIGGSTITYRGTVVLAGRGEGLEVDAAGTEARGNGTVRLRLTVVPRPVEDGSGTTLSYTGSVEAKGRLAELDARQRETAARRLLDRFTEALVGEISAAAPAAPNRADDDEPAIPGIPGPAERGTDGRAADATEETDGTDTADGTDAGPADDATAGEQDAENDPDPEPDLGAEPAADRPQGTGDHEDAAPSAPAEPASPGRDHLGGPHTPEDADDLVDPVEAQPPYAPEADLARRTMIG
ncbi:SRPBCC domain-containing protein, partial [Streptomyces sp. SM14]|uniref:SRPBCC domain-containing protein n=1 Tax=Streptomyces sp. SM14 TaxID=1736045 RepID=UPI000CD55F26